MRKRAINYYLDTSIVAASYFEDPISQRADEYINQHRGDLYVSAWTRLELASAANRLVQSGDLSVGKAKAIMERYVGHLGVYFNPRPITLNCFASAQEQLGSFSVPLKAPDALHLGVVAQMQRGLGATTLVTNDGQMARAAASFGLAAYHLTE